MAYKYILDIAHIEHIIDLFLEFVSQQPEQHGMKPSFTNGYLWGNEGYKMSTFIRGTDKLFAKPWNKKTIDSGAVADMAIRAMSIQENNTDSEAEKAKLNNGNAFPDRKKKEGQIEEKGRCVYRPRSDRSSG